MTKLELILIATAALPVAKLLALLALTLLVYRLTLLIKQVERRLTSAFAANKLELYTTIGGQEQKVEHMFQKVNEQKTIKLKIKDRFGNEAKVDGAPKWAVTDEALAELTVAEDALSAVCTPKGTVGSFKVQVKADADLGEGVKEILGELAIDLAAGDAEVLELSAE